MQCNSSLAAAPPALSDVGVQLFKEQQLQHARKNTKTKQKEMTGEEIFELSKLISSEGYDCIVETIFSKLDPLSLAKCRSVSKAWKALIDKRRSLSLSFFCRILICIKSGPPYYTNLKKTTVLIV